MLARAKTEDRREELRAELAATVLPAAGAYLWSAYSRLRRRKGGNGFGASPLEWLDIQAFMAAARYPLAPWEIEIIEAIDDLYLVEQLSKQTSSGRGQSA